MKLLRLVLVLVIVALSTASAHAAGPKSLKAVFTKPVAKKSIGKLNAGDSVVAAAILKNVTGGQPVATTLSFKARVDGISVATAWRTGTATSLIRLVGVNIDLVDANDALLASDTFAGILDGYAHSTLVFHGLVRDETYRVILTGTQVTAGSYTMAIEEYVPPAP